MVFVLERLSLLSRLFLLQVLVDTAVSVECILNTERRPVSEFILGYIVCIRICLAFAESYQPTTSHGHSWFKQS